MSRETTTADYRLKIALVALLCATLRIIVFLLTDNVEGDGAVRVYETYRWMDSPHFITGGVWLPRNYYLTALFLWIWNNPLVTPRILSLLAGVLTLFPFCAVVKNYFGEKSAIISGIIFSFYITHMVYSVLGLAEAPFLLFVFTSFYFLSLALNKEKHFWRFLFLSIIFFIFAEMTRIESWLLIPFFALFLYLRNFKKGAFYFILFASAFPIFWLLGCYLDTGDFLPLASANINPENLAYWTTAKKIYAYPYILLKFITPLILLFSLAGLVKNFMAKEKYEAGICFLVQLSFLVSITVFGTNAAPKPRYTLLSSLFLIPYFYDGFKVFLSIIKSERILASLTIAAYLVTTFSVINYGTQVIFPVFEDEGKRIVKWIDDNGLKNEKILFGKCRGGDPNIALRAGMSWRNADWILGYPDYKIFSLRKIYPYSEENFVKYLLNERPSSVITSYPTFLYNIEKIIRKNESLMRKIACTRSERIAGSYFRLELSYNPLDE